MLVGTLLALAVLQPTDMHWQELHAHLSLLIEEYDFSIPELPGLDFSRIELDWQRLRSTIPEIWKFTNDGREFQVGEQMKARGLKAEYPVILIPGVISTVASSICSLQRRLMDGRIWSRGQPLLNIAHSFARSYGED